MGINLGALIGSWLVPIIGPPAAGLLGSRCRPSDGAQARQFRLPDITSAAGVAAPGRRAN
jgi:hypothetical protein